MVDIRTVSLPGIWAEDAQTTIPTPPIANTTYRNLEWGETEANQGWPFQKIVDSADFNQAMWYVFTLQKMQEQFGILPWCSTTEYKQNGICLGSDGIFYWAKKDNTGVNPVTDSGMTNWGVFLDPGDNFVTETLLNNQIALCEKLANKTQTLSSSSTSTQYPSAKAVYDNINNAKTQLTQSISNETQARQSADSNLQSAIDAVEANYVTTNTNQAISGTKTFTQTPFMNSSGNAFGFIAQNNNINVGQTPPETQYIGYDFRGNNGNRLAFIGIEYNQNGRKYLTFQNIENAYQSTLFNTNVETQGTLANTDNSKFFAYTSWVNSRISSIVNNRSRVNWSGKVTLSIGNNYTCPSYGFVVANIWETELGVFLDCYINNWIYTILQGASYKCGGQAFMLVNPQDVVNFVKRGNIGKSSIYFVPFSS